MENRRKRTRNRYNWRRSIWGYFILSILNPKKWWNLWRTNELRYFFISIYIFIGILSVWKTLLTLFDEH